MRTLVSNVLACIFDLDGVLIESEQVNISAAIRTFQELGMPLTVEELAEIPGKASSKFIPRFLENRGIASAPETIDAIVKHNRANYDALWETDVKLMPAVSEVLAALKARGIVMAIATMNRRVVAERFLDKFGFREHFSAYVTAQDVQRHKPDPEVYLRVRERLGLPPEQIIVVEDTEVGVFAAKGAGLFCMAVPNRFSVHQNFSQADFICSSLTQLLTLL